MQYILKDVEIYFSWGGEKKGFLKLIFWISAVYISSFISWKVETNWGTSIPNAVKPMEAIPFKCLIK